MDIQKLNEAHKLLEKSQATEMVINTLKNLGTDLKLENPVQDEFLKSLYTIKEDLFMRLIDMKAQYDKDFGLL